MRNNLGRWEAGTSGNEGGRPKSGKIITAAVKEELNKTSVGGFTKLQQIIVTLVDKAIDGDVSAIKLIWSYLEGIPKEREEITEDGPPRITINTLNSSSS